MPTSFWSFIFIVVKGSWTKVGGDLSTSFEKTVLKVEGQKYPEQPKRISKRSTVNFRRSELTFCRKIVMIFVFLETLYMV